MTLPSIFLIVFQKYFPSYCSFYHSHIFPLHCSNNNIAVAIFTFVFGFVCQSVSAAFHTVYKCFFESLATKPFSIAGYQKMTSTKFELRALGYVYTIAKTTPAFWRKSMNSVGQFSSNKYHITQGPTGISHSPSHQKKTLEIVIHLQTL